MPVRLLVETIKAKDKRFISYGVDLGTRISTNQDSQHGPRSVASRAQRCSDNEERPW